jgi:RNA polymerase sigma-70 factor (ECF subfamily)
VTNLPEYVAAVYRFALRLSGNHHDAEDITQESFLRAWQHCDRLRDPRAVRTWLFRVAANLWRDRVRRGRHRAARADAISDDLECRTILPGDALVAREDVSRAVAAMDRLPPRQREVLYLHACEGLSHAEIGAVLGITFEGVKASLSIARKKMRQQLVDPFVDEAMRDEPIQ